MRVLNASTNKYDVANFGSDAALEYPKYPSINQKDFEKKYKSLMKSRIESVTNALVSNFFFGILNRLFIRGKIYNEVEKIILKELKNADLMK